MLTIKETGYCKMKYKHSKHVTLICDLEVGDIVTTEYRKKLIGKQFKIIEINPCLGYSSGIRIKLDGFKGYMDSDWVDKTK